MYFVSLSESRHHHGYVCENFDDAKNKMIKLFKNSSEFPYNFENNKSDEMEELFTDLLKCKNVNEAQRVIWEPCFDYISTRFEEIGFNKLIELSL